MKEEKRVKVHNIWGLFALIGVAVCLTVGSLYGILRLTNSYSQSILNEYDRQLMVTAQVVERNAGVVIENYLEILNEIIEKPELRQAEDVWRNTGETADLLRCMQWGIGEQERAVFSLLAIRDGELLLSSNGNYNYTFCINKGTSEEVRLMHDQEVGTHYIAFLQKRQELTYVLMVRAEECYQEIEGTGLVGTENDLCLMDASGTLLVHNEGGHIQAETMQQGAAERGTVREMLTCQQEGEPRIIFYEAKDANGQSFEARTAALPASALTHNFLLVGIRSNYDEVRRPQVRMATGLVILGVMLICGLSLLLVLLLYSDSHSRKAQREVVTLTRRNEEMERINAQFQSLAHHQRLELIGTMTSGVAHEFNNLLTPIMGYSMMVMEKLPEDDEECYDNMLAIYEASRKAKNIIARLGSLSRKNNAVASQYIDPDELVRRTLEVAKPTRPKNVEIVTELNCKDRWLYGSETGLSQMLLNLVLNGCHALKAEGGTLTVATESDKTTIYLHVSDNGPGIPEDIREKIYQPFYTTKGNEGTGLGLAIVQQMVSEHGGEIRLFTEVGQGTEFVVCLPRARYKGPEEMG